MCEFGQGVVEKEWIDSMEQGIVEVCEFSIDELEFLDIGCYYDNESILVIE